MSGIESVCFIVLQYVNIFLRVKYLTKRLKRENKASLLHRGYKFKDVFKYICVWDDRFCPAVILNLDTSRWCIYMRVLFLDCLLKGIDNSSDKQLWN